MSDKTCACGRGYFSAYDGKCGHCRTNNERAAHRRMFENGWSKEEASLGYRYKRREGAA